MTTVDRLRVIYEMDDANFRRGSERMRRNSNQLNRDIEGGFARSSRGISGMGRAAIGAAGGILTLGAAMAKLKQYSDSYITIENRLRSIGQFSDEAAEKLLAGAMRSRTGIEAMSTAVARIQKSTGDSFDQTIRRVETLNKLLTVGGATAGERGSVMLQLSQALTSGTLQGDELRSLRENSPIEVLDAIAKAAGVTRGELKKMGEEGRLTSDIIIEALDSLADTADGKMKNAVMTTADAWTNLQSAMTVFVGRADEGLGGIDALTTSLNDMAEWLEANTDEAEEFGIKFRAALQTIGEYLDIIKQTLIDFGVISEKTFNADHSTSFGDEIMTIVEYMAVLNGAIEGASAVAEELFKRIPDAISSGIISASDAVSSAIETMINFALDGLRKVAALVDSMTAGIADLMNFLPGSVGGYKGSSLASKLPENIELPRASDNATPTNNASWEPIGDVYDAASEAARDAASRAAQDVIQDVKDRFAKNVVNRRAENLLRDYAAPGSGSRPLGSADSPAGGGAGGSGSGGRRGRSGREEEPFFERSKKRQQQLQREIELLGMTTSQQAAMRAEWELLDEAKSRGIKISDSMLARIRQEAQEVGQLTEQLEKGKLRQQDFEKAVDGISDALAGALLAGESFRDGIAQVFKSIASDILRSGIKEAIQGQFDFANGGMRGGGGFFSNLIGSIFGGFRAGGGPVRRGKAYVVGEKEPELFVPDTSGTILNQSQLGGSGQAPKMTIINQDSGYIRVQPDYATKDEVRLAVSLLERSVPSIVSENQERMG